MLYVYIGDEQSPARKKVQATIARMVARHPDARYFRVTDETATEYNLEELAESQALFKSEYVVLLDTLITHGVGDKVLERLELLAESPHPFFILEHTVPAAVQKKLAARAQKFEEFQTAQRNAVAPFNTFALSDAFAIRDKKKLWTLFQEARYRNVSAEEIHGVLFWMCKSLVVATSATSALDAGMKTYPFNKACRFAKKYTQRELQEQLYTCALIPYEARRAGMPLEIELEKFILSY